MICASINNESHHRPRRSMVLCAAGILQVALLFAHGVVEASAWQSSLTLHSSSGASRQGPLPPPVASSSSSSSFSSPRNRLLPLCRGRRLAVSTLTPTTAERSFLSALLVGWKDSVSHLSDGASNNSTPTTTTSTETTAAMVPALAAKDTQQAQLKRDDYQTQRHLPIIVASLVSLTVATVLWTQSPLGVAAAFSAYQTALIARPLTSKVLTGAVLALLGDALAQYSASSRNPLSTSSFSYDRRRALSFAAFDACYRVFQHVMFPAVIGLCQGTVLRRILPMAAPNVAAAIERTMLYQLVIVPSLYYPVFFVFTGFIQGLSFRETIDRMKSNYFRCWGRNLQVSLSISQACHVMHLS